MMYPVLRLIISAEHSYRRRNDRIERFRLCMGLPKGSHDEVRSRSGKLGSAHLTDSIPSTPSYRWAFLLWIALAVFAILFALAHHLRLSGGSLGSAWAKFAMRRHTIGSKKPGRRNRALPSNGLILTFVLIAVITLVFSLIGSDYIAPASSVLDFSTSFTKRLVSPTSPTGTIGKSWWTLGSRFGFMAFALTPLVVLFALKTTPANLLAWRPLAHLHSDKLQMLHRATAWLVWALTTAHVVLWTIQLFKDQRNGKPTWIFIWNSYRFIFGCVAYAAMTAVMVFSLRPVRKNRYEFFYVAHVVLVLLTLVACVVHHPVLWYWIAAAAGLWAIERITRFIRFVHTNGLMGAKSRRNQGSDVQAGRPYSTVPVDDQSYGMQEFKPAMDASINPYETKTLPRIPSTMDQSNNWQTGQSNQEFGRRVSHAGFYDDGSLQPLGSYDQRYVDPYAAEGHVRAGSAGSALLPPGMPDQSYAHRSSTSMSRGNSPSGQSHLAPAASIAMTPSGSYDGRSMLAPTPEILIGFAQAQLLPSRTVRLTIRPPKPFKWSPGQSCSLYLPELSKVQSHPFTITNTDGDDEIIILVKARKGMTRRLYDLVRSRSLASMGVLAQKNERLSLQGVKGSHETEAIAPPIYVRVWVDGPFGSAARVRWNEWSTILVICGGSGVSFGTAICEHACQIIRRNQQNPSSKTRTQRIRFCWVAREYAEIAWVAGQLYRCQGMMTAAQLEISIFITNAPTGPGPTMRYDDGAFDLPQPRFAKTLRRGSSDSDMSVSSDMSTESISPMETLENDVDDGAAGALSAASTQYADVIDLTNYDDEEDVADPAEQHLSQALQKQGKMRRAKKRKAKKQAELGIGGGASPLSPRRKSSIPFLNGRRVQSGLSVSDSPGLIVDVSNGIPPRQDTASPPRMSKGYDNSLLSPSYSKTSLRQSYLQAGQEEAGGHGHSGHLAAPHPIASGEDWRRQSYRSIADSTYGRFDPYATSGEASLSAGGFRHPSPSPSINFDDAQSVAGESVRGLMSRASRTDSMVLIEEPLATAKEYDAGLWLNQADHASMIIMSETARPGKPKLGQVLEEEIDRAQGAIIVASECSVHCM